MYMYNNYVVYIYLAKTRLDCWKLPSNSMSFPSSYKPDGYK